MKGRRHDLDVIVIGAGSAGFSAALSAAQSGARVALIERAALGGDCPRYACIPTKSFLHAAANSISWKRAQTHAAAIADVLTGSRLTGLLAANNITHIKGEAHIVGAHTIVVGKREWTATSIVMTMGAKNIIPDIPGLKTSGYLTYATLLAAPKPPSSAIILGGGAVAVELANILLGYNTKVTIIEAQNQLLPHHEPEIASAVEASLRAKGADIYTGAYAVKIERAAKTTVLIHQGRMEFQLQAGALILAVGREGTQGNIVTDQFGRVIPSGNRAPSPNLFAAGDCVMGPRHTHVATAEGERIGANAAAHALGRKDLIARQFTVIPQTVFSDPEVAMAGLTEAQARAQKIPYVTGRAFFAGYGRALTRGTGEGLVKVIAHAKTGTILGASIVGHAASELIHELVLAITLRATVYDVGNMLHAYPTGSETIKAACKNAYAQTP